MNTHAPHQLLRSLATSLLCHLVFLLPLIAPAFAQSQTAAVSTVPRLIKFSGTVNGAQGSVHNAPIGITFALYKDQQGGAPLWLETQNLQVDVNGHYTASLGAASSAGIPQDLFATGEARWLGVQVQGQAEQPRVMLLAVPYALKAADAETIGGLPPSAFVLAAPIPGSAPLPSAATASASSSNTSTASPNPPVTGLGTVNFVPLWDTTGDIVNSALFQSGSGAAAKVGINTNTPATTLDVKGTGTIRGSLSFPATGVATAAAGKPSQPVNQAASSFNSGTHAAVNQTFRWQAEPAANNTASPSGTLNLLFGSGTQQPVETGLKINNLGVFTFADAQTFPNTGTITGVTATGGLTGGGTSGNVTVALTGSCALGQILQWNSIGWNCANVVTNVTPGIDLTESGTLGNITLSVDTTQVPQLNSGNTFTGNQTVNGNLSSTGLVTGSGFNIGSNLFAFGSFTQGNVFLGFAGNTTTTGTSNTASGGSALLANTTGIDNTATGGLALASNTTGNLNTASGFDALPFNTTGVSNTANGVFALNSNSTGNANTASGSSSLASNTTGGNNTASGSLALASNTTGSNNAALGYNAGPDSGHPNLTNATAIGANAVVSQSNALVLGGTGANAVNVGIGTATPASTLDVHGTGNFTGLITFASGQTFPGVGTITGVTAGTDLIGGGSSGSVTLNLDTTKVMTGIAAGADLIGGGTGGVQTLSLDTTKVPQLAAANTFTGSQTVNGNLSATGIVTGSSYQIGSNLFAFGDFANNNAYLGFAGGLTTTGTGNTGSGGLALSANTTGSYNAASGYDALLKNTTGDGNTANGTFALTFNSGSYNTAIGYSAMIDNTGGTNNTALGANAGPDHNNPNLTNATAIGANADVTFSNSLVLGSINGKNGATADTNVGIGTTAPDYRLHIGNALKSFRVEGPATSGSGALAASFGGFGDFGIDAPGIVSGRFVVKESGNVGIGTAAPDSLLSVNGSADKPGGGSWGTFSDGRLKTLDGDFQTGLSAIQNLHPVRYRYKQGNGMGITDRAEHIGFVAQEVQKVIPEAVSENSRGYLLVNNDPILWTMLNAIKEQQREIADLRGRLHKETAKEKAVESRLTQLESHQHIGNSVASLYPPSSTRGTKAWRQTPGAGRDVPQFAQR